jgi:hypothetical protein
MYGYILGQWRMGAVTSQWVQACAPRWITEVEADEIVASPQDLIGTQSMEV